MVGGGGERIVLNPQLATKHPKCPRTRKTQAKNHRFSLHKTFGTQQFVVDG
jgi:hypothetical protein